MQSLPSSDRILAALEREARIVSGCCLLFGVIVPCALAALLVLHYAHIP